MARGGRISLDVKYKDFEKVLQSTISKVERGTRKATVQACEDIKTGVMREVPRDTETLANAFSYTVHRDATGFWAELGFGLEKDPINPKQQRPASDYMIAVHEDLEAHHKVGKAKFLEDPLNAYKSQFRSRIAVEIRKEL